MTWGFISQVKVLLHKQVGHMHPRCITADVNKQAILSAQRLVMIA